MLRRLQSTCYLIILILCIKLCCCVFGVDDLDFRQDSSEGKKIVVLKSIEEISDLLHGSDDSLLLVAVHAASCPFSRKMLDDLDESAVALASFFESIDLNVGNVTAPPPKIATLDSTKMDKAWMQTLGIESYPSLLFFRQEEYETVVIEYLGSKANPSEITESILHYWYRYSVGPVILMSTLHELKLFIQEHGVGMLRHIPHPINPDYTREEQKMIRWLMNSQEDYPDSFTLLFTCQALPSESFYELAKVVASQRDVALFAIADCEHVAADGDIVSTWVDPNSWELGFFRKKASESIGLHEFALSTMTPSVLFYDRISTGPIAFAKHRKIHAVLFVQLYFDHVSYSVIRSFRQACQNERKHHEEDLVCMVMPDTETRILTHFGVDIWTGLDDKISFGTQVAPVLPAMLITDQRQGRLRRYFLNASDIIGDMTTISKFLRDFWHDNLPVQRKSSSKPIKTNSHGVMIISGTDFSSVVLQKKDKHTLLYLHSPTCGHCKRFSVVWNELARMVKATKWDSFVDVVQLDVTENEIVEVNIDPGFLPALYYLPSPNKTEFVQFDAPDNAGETVGRLNDPIDILDWMLSHGSFDKENLLKLITELQEEETQGVITDKPKKVVSNP